MHCHLHCQTEKSKEMDMRFNWVKYRTRQGNFFILWGPVKTNKSDYFTKHHPPSHNKAMMHEYSHKSNNILRFVLPQGCINHIMGLTSTEMSHGPRGPKSNRQKLGGSISDCINIISKETYQKYNHKETTV